MNMNVGTFPVNMNFGQEQYFVHGWSEKSGWTGEWFDACACRQPGNANEPPQSHNCPIFSFFSLLDNFLSHLGTSLVEPKIGNLNTRSVTHFLIDISQIETGNRQMSERESRPKSKDNKTQNFPHNIRVSK